MFLRRHLTQPSVRAGISTQLSGALGPGSNRLLNDFLSISSSSEQPQQLHSLSGCPVDAIGKKLSDVPCPLGRSGEHFRYTSANKNIFLPYSMSIGRLIHAGSPKEFEGGPNSRPTNFDITMPDMRGANDSGRSSPAMGFARAMVDSKYGETELGRAILDRPGTSNFGRLTFDRNGTSGYGREFVDWKGNNFPDGFRSPRRNVEQNADIVHVKLLRNNTFVTVTDSKGNKKFGTSAGKLTDKGGKVSRYAAEASSEQIGRDARSKGIKSLVVKVNGFTHFKKKKQAILSLKEGYSLSRGDKNPIVYIEDTTRRPHNGCRLRKKRRV